MSRFALDTQSTWVTSTWVTARKRLRLALLISMLAVGLMTDGGLSIAAELETSADQAWLGQVNQDASLEATSYIDSPNSDSLTGSDSGWKSNQAPNSQPTNWIFGPYLKAGPTFVLGKDLLADRLDTGYSIVGGVRQLLGPGLGNSNAFVDMGGSYLSAFGQLTRTVLGEEFNNTGSSLGPVDSAFNATLTEIRRGGVHVGLGCYWGSPVENRRDDPQVRFSTTFGGRLSHIHGEFDTEQLVFPPVAAGGDAIKPVYSKTDTAGGLYVNAQAIFLRRNTGLGIMQFTVDGEFAHDWIELGGFENGGLGTASVLCGFLMTR